MAGEVLPRVIRQSGIAAPQRVARILKTGGPAGVLAEISRIEGSYGKRIYFTELMKAATLDAAMRARVLTQAGREIDSDFELATLLIERPRPARDRRRDATGVPRRRTQHRLRLRAAPCAVGGAEDRNGAPAVLARPARYQHCDRLRLRGGVAARRGREGVGSSTAARAAFFRAVATVESDFERHRVLTVVADRPNVTAPTLAAVLDAGASMGSDFEQAGSWSRSAGAMHSTASCGAVLPGPRLVGSSFERGQVLQAVVQQPDLSDDVLESVLRAAAATSGAFEASQVLQATASRHHLAGKNRDLYISIASRLGSSSRARP